MLNSTAQDLTIFWHGHISAFVSSGTTQKNYCKINELSYSKFKQWRYKLSDEFPVDQKHPRARENKAKKAMDIITTEKINGNKFAAVKLIANSNLNQPRAQFTKLYLNQNIYLELATDIDVKNLNKIFTALGVL